MNRGKIGDIVRITPHNSNMHNLKVNSIGTVVSLEEKHNSRIKVSETSRDGKRTVINIVDTGEYVILNNFKYEVYI